MRLLSLVLLLTASACGGGGDRPGPDAGELDPSLLTLVDGCAPDALDRCDYLPGAPFERVMPVETVALDYMDVIGATRTFEVAVRVPDGAPEPMPVVVWSHGGNEGIANPLNVAPEWAEAFVGAGYVTISIAHAGRNQGSINALCAELGYILGACASFKHLHWDRPHDAARVFDFIEEQAASGPLAGRIDPEAIVYAGHSAGAGGVLMVSGAPRDYAGTSHTLADPRPIAFVENSPQGPGDEGFDRASFGGVDRPTLIHTGRGDDTPSVKGTNRTRAFDLMPPGDKFRLYIEEEAARHGTFNLEADACLTYADNQGIDPARCEDYRSWLVSSSLAFVDAYVRQDATAQSFLASDNLVLLAGGGATWDRR